MNFYKRFMGDYGRDTAHLSLAEHGTYTLLLDHYYSTEAPLPADYVPLYRICRAFDDAEQLAVRTVADQYFPVGQDGKRHNGRADAQIAEDRNRIDTAKENGRKGGRPKKQSQPAPQEEPDNKPNENPTGFDSETHSAPQEEPTTKARHSQSHTQEPDGSFVREAARATDAAMTSCPADFTPTVAHRGLAVNLHLDLPNELGMFLANARSKGRMSADWNAEFEVWLRRSRNFGNGKDQQPGASGKNTSSPRDDARRATANTLGVGSQYLTPEGSDYEQITR